MPKLKVPLLSLDAKGALSKLFSYVHRGGHNIIERKPIPTDAKSPDQLFFRHMFTKCIDLWHLLSEAEQKEWESLARPRHMTGYAWFISQCLRPNPGIYLPLQGGTMSGDIDMDKNRLLKLPLPTDDQEAASKKYHDDNLPPGGYTEGARVYHSANQNIPNLTVTMLAFNSERYDTDTIHDPIIANSKLVCKTAGKYLIIAQVTWQANVTGTRYLYLKLNSIAIIANVLEPGYSPGNRYELGTIYNLSVNDFIEVQVYQNSGVALLVLTSPNISPEFMMQRIG